jgi:hypothetical protein
MIGKLIWKKYVHIDLTRPGYRVFQGIVLKTIRLQTNKIVVFVVLTTAGIERFKAFFIEGSNTWEPIFQEFSAPYIVQYEFI